MIPSWTIPEMHCHVTLSHGTSCINVFDTMRIQLDDHPKKLWAMTVTDIYCQP